VGFFEVHAENYMGAGGLPHAQLSKLRQDYALSIHGVGLSIGSMQPLNLEHLKRLKELCDRYEPERFSEHLAWSTHDGIFMNDLLPLPYNEATLNGVCEHIDQVQTVVGRQMLLENPATYLAFSDSTIAEAEFLAKVATRTGCGLLLDINNVVVAVTNHGQDPHEYLAVFPVAAVGEIHLGGHSEAVDGNSRLLIDSHNLPICETVWTLYEKALLRTGPLASLVEWDNDVPEWAKLRDEALAAQAIINRVSQQLAA
jgi:uncharacterized protein (UPF0276 family)